PGTIALTLGRRFARSAGTVSGWADVDVDAAAGSLTIVAPIQSGRVWLPPATSSVPPSPTQVAIACQPSSSTDAPGSSTSDDTDWSSFDSGASRSRGVNQ